MSMFTQAFNSIRSTVSNPKFYTSARASAGKAIAAAQAYAPKVLANPYGRIGVGAGVGSIAGASMDSKNRGRGALVGGALGGAGTYGAFNPAVRGSAMGFGAKAARSASAGAARLSRMVR